MFKIGDYVVKPNTGICRIEDIVFMSLVGKEKKQYYVLLPIDDDRAKLYVTTDADRTRLRPVMTTDESREFIKKIADIEAVWVPNDKMREQQYKEAFKTNEPESLVAIIKNLYGRSQIRIAQGKKVTSTDEKYYKQAEKALYSELAFSLGVEMEEIINKVAGLITK
jgi:CarD family transcriptional regulator